jgi:hypothetical protein
MHLPIFLHSNAMQGVAPMFETKHSKQIKRESRRAFAKAGWFKTRIAAQEAR